MQQTEIPFLLLTSVNNGGLDVGADGTGVAAKGLDLLDDPEGLIVSNLAEDDVLAVEPRGHNGGDEELRAVAMRQSVLSPYHKTSRQKRRKTYVLGPALAMERIPGLVCLKRKFSSANFSP